MIEKLMGLEADIEDQSIDYIKSKAITTSCSLTME